MRRVICLLPLLTVACSASNPADKAAADRKAIAQVEAAQNLKPPAKPITPQPILFFDITASKLYGSGCNFVPEGGGMGAVLLAQTDRGVLKLNDKIVVLAADKGSKQMPQGAWSHYTGKEFALAFSKVADGHETQNGVVTLFDGEVTITDPNDGVVYSAKGNVQCKPM